MGASVSGASVHVWGLGAWGSCAWMGTSVPDEGFGALGRQCLDGWGIGHGGVGAWGWRVLPPLLQGIYEQAALLVIPLAPPLVRSRPPSSPHRSRYARSSLRSSMYTGCTSTQSEELELGNGSPSHPWACVGANAWTPMFAIVRLLQAAAIDRYQICIHAHPSGWK